MVIFRRRTASIAKCKSENEILSGRGVSSPFFVILLQFHSWNAIKQLHFACRNIIIN